MVSPSRTETTGPVKAAMVLSESQSLRLRRENKAEKGFYYKRPNLVLGLQL